MEEYFDTVLEEAKNEFWRVISQAYPKIGSGDIEPDALEEFDNKCIEVINDWLKNNI